MDGQPSGSQAIAPALPRFLAVDVLMHELAIHCSVISRPLVLDVNQRLLTTTESEVLHRLKELPGRGTTQLTVVLENNQLPYCHLAPGGRVVVFKHIEDGMPQ